MEQFGTVGKKIPDNGGSRETVECKLGKGYKIFKIILDKAQEMFNLVIQMPIYTAEIQKTVVN